MIKQKSANAKLKGEHPLFGLMKTKTSSLKKEPVGVHPRVFIKQIEIAALDGEMPESKE